MINPLVIAVPAASAVLITAFLYPIAQCLAVVSWGTGYILKNIIFIWLACILASIILALVNILLLKGAFRKLTIAIFAAALLTLSGPLAFKFGNQIRHAAFIRLAVRSKPLILAIERHKQNAGMLPNRLVDLVPLYLPSVPGTGMAAYPAYIYEADTQRGTYSLFLSTPNNGFANLDEFRYSSNGEYPDYGKYWEAIGDWKYYHE
jgi:hypothetical protein